MTKRIIYVGTCKRCGTEAEHGSSQTEVACKWGLCNGTASCTTPREVSW